MNTQHPLTQAANSRLVAALERFGNRLTIDHKKALCSLNDAMTSMSEGTLTGRWAFGLPTGTGKTRAIVERAAAIHTAGLPHSFAVSASRIEALCTLKRDMIEAGVPEASIGLLHEAPLTGDHRASLPATKDNDTRPFLLCTHAMIRADVSNVTRYNLYLGKPRDLLLYDESLMVSDVTHFGTRPLYAACAYALEMFRGKPEHADIANYITEIKATIFAAEDKLNPIVVTMIDQPAIDPGLAAHYIRYFTGKNEQLLSHFLQAANMPLRLVRSGTEALISYTVAIPEALKNVIVLDASYPVRSLCQFDSTMKAADEHLPGLKSAGVKLFATLKRFDSVDLYRLKSYGGRTSMEKRFRDKKAVKEVVDVLKTIPADESVLMFVYKRQDQVRSLDYAKVLLSAMRAEGINPDKKVNGKSRVSVLTWGSETSLNTYGHCKHVFLVGILHRAETELLGQYLGQIQDIEADVSTMLARDIQRSEKAHLAYQALSRGSCRFIDQGQARPMKGYIVEIDPLIEEELSAVMPGATWHTWEPKFLAEAGDLVGVWSQKVIDHLATLPKSTSRVSSQSLKKAVHAETLSRDTWTQVIQSFKKMQGAPNKSHMEDQAPFLNDSWYFDEKSLVRKELLAEAYGF